MLRQVRSAVAVKYPTLMLRIQSGLPVSSVNATLGNLSREFVPSTMMVLLVLRRFGTLVATLTPVADCSTTLAATLLPKVVDFNSTNASWIYGNLRPAELVSFPLLMLVPGRKAFCFQPCGWVNDHMYYTKFSRCVSKRLAFLHRCQFLMKRCFMSVKASIQKCPGFHPDAQSKITARDFPPNR